MWRLLCFVSALVTLASGQESTAVSTCQFSTGVLPINTYIEGCPTPPCWFPQLENAVLHLVFRVPHTVRRMRTLAKAYLFGLPIGVDHDLKEAEETCNFLANTYCPVLKDEVVVYTLNMFIEPDFFVGAVATIEFKIVDENETDLVCIRVPIRIIAPITEGRNANATSVVDNN